MATFTASQLDAYLKLVSFPQSHLPIDPNSLAHLALLQRHQMSSIPFESLSMHYSTNFLLNLDPEDVYRKFIERRRGGYCMENNNFFACMLRSFGFQIFTVGGRVSNAVEGRTRGGFQGWNHQLSIVTIDSQRYLVDVGFGGNGPTHPILLKPGITFTNLSPAIGRLEYKKLEQHTDPSQRVWVYSYKINDSADWFEAYSFVELEFLPEDYAVMNLSTMGLRKSLFTQVVLAEKTILGEDEDPEFGGKAIIGVLILVGTTVKRRINGNSEVLQEFKSEDERVKGLEKWFGIRLSDEERRGIRDLPTEIR